MMKEKQYVAFLRGINVGGHHKVPMAELRTLMNNIGYSDVTTLLNSGNVIFTANEENKSQIETTISKALKSMFGFSVPTIVKSAARINTLYNSNPFNNIVKKEDHRFYITFLTESIEESRTYPIETDIQSYVILNKDENEVFSVLDLSVSKTVKAMKILQDLYGKQITTRNWNTITRICNKINN